MAGQDHSGRERITMARLRIGTCSWKFPSWYGLVYPAPKGINYLEVYARQYDTVEIDQWFWSLFGQDSLGLPRPADVEEYRRSVPDEFVFTVKAPNSVTLTHFYRKVKAEPPVENPHFLSPTLFRSFLSRLDPLGDTLGPVMLQFEYLNRQKMTSQSRFQELLEAFNTQLPAGYQYGLEVRNAKYLNHSFFEFLVENHLIPVLLQGYWMPPITDVYEQWHSLIHQHEVIVIRLLGPERKEIEKQTGKRWDRIVAPKDKELVAIVDMVEDLLAHGLNVYLNVNNHYEGSAPLTIERIRRLLGE
jgi:uncharacterized protein YecE (DUF72 family)